jgi:hypothetical protein
MIPTSGTGWKDHRLLQEIPEFGRKTPENFPARNKSIGYSLIKK